MSSWFDSDPLPASSFAEPIRPVEEAGELYAVLPICICIDTSGSMAGAPIEAVNACLPELQKMVRDDPTVGELARIGIVAFDNTARRVLEMSDIQYVKMPSLSASGGTSYGEALCEAKTFIETSVRALGNGRQFYRPILFFISDGAPSDAKTLWGPAAQALHDRGKYSPHVVAFGMGDQVDMAVLAEVSPQFAFKAKNEDLVAATRGVFEKIVSSVKLTSRSAEAAVASGGAPTFEIDRSITEEFDWFRAPSAIQTN
jgi:uncharacterized protein YegL